MIFQLLNYINAVFSVITGWLPLAFITQTGNIATIAEYAQFAVMVQIMSVMEGAIYARTTLAHSSSREGLASTQAAFIFALIPVTGFATAVLSKFFALSVESSLIAFFFCCKIVETYFRGILNSLEKFETYLKYNIVLKILVCFALVALSQIHTFSVTALVMTLSGFQVVLVFCLLPHIADAIPAPKLDHFYGMKQVALHNFHVGAVGLSGVLLFAVDRTILSIRGEEVLLAELQLVYSLFGLFLIAASTAVSSILARIYEDSTGNVTWACFVVVSEMLLIGFYFFVRHSSEILTALGVFVPPQFLNDDKLLFFWGLGVFFMAILQPIFYFNLKNSKNTTLIYLPVFLSICYCMSSLLLLPSGDLIPQFVIWSLINGVVFFYNLLIFFKTTSVSVVVGPLYKRFLLIVPIIVGTGAFSVLGSYAAIAVTMGVSCLLCYFTSIKSFLNLTRVGAMSG